MSEEDELLTTKVSRWHPQKQVLIKMNNQIVKLLNVKLIPLNKMRYSHLQKINQAIPKKINSSYSSALNFTVNFNERENKQTGKLSPIEKIKTERRSNQNRNITTDVLINRLKNLKELKLKTHLMNQDEKAGKCWQTLRNSILKSQNPSSPQQETSREGYKSNHKRKRQNLMELAERAHQYLRIKKHQLKQKYFIESEGASKRKLQKKQQQIESMLGKWKLKTKSNLKIEQCNDKQLERELLRDIRKNMLETNLNRMKLDINHKKIVEMR